MEASDQPRPRDPVMAANIRILDATGKKTSRDAQALKTQLLIHMQKRNAIYEQMCMWMEMSRQQLRPDPVNFPYALAQQQQRGTMLQQLRDTATSCKSFDGRLLQRELYRSKNIFDAKVAKSNSLLAEDLQDILLKNDTASSSAYADEEQAVPEEATTPNGSHDASDPPLSEDKDEQQKETASTIPLDICSAGTPTAHSPMEPTIAASSNGKVSSIVKKLEIENDTTSIPPPRLAVRDNVQSKTTTKVSNIIAMFGEAGSQLKATPLPDIRVPKGRVASICESLSEKPRGKPATVKSFASGVTPKGKVSVTARKFEINTNTVVGASTPTCTPTAVSKAKVATMTRVFEDINKSTPSSCTPTELKSKGVVKTGPSGSPPNVAKMIAVFEKAEEDHAIPSVTLKSAAVTATPRGILAGAAGKFKDNSGTVPVCTSSGVSVSKETALKQTPVPKDDQDTVTCTEPSSFKPTQGSSDKVVIPKPQISQVGNEGPTSPRAPPRKRKRRRRNRKQKGHSGQ